MNSIINYSCNEYKNCDHVMFTGNCNGCGNLDTAIEQWKTNIYTNTNTNTNIDNFNKSFEIKDVIFNDPATIVFWTDGSKTVVKCKGKDAFDPEKGLAMAIVKKVFGNQGNYYNKIRKWIEP